jgi:hypothetical protein
VLDLLTASTSVITRIVIQWQLSAILADLGDLGTHLEHDPLDAAPDRKITTRRAPRRQARQMRST